MLDSPNYFSPTAESSASVTQISLFARPGRGGSKRQVFSQTRQRADFALGYTAITRSHDCERGTPGACATVYNRQIA
jgi:hypothetical protein